MGLARDNARMVGKLVVVAAGMFAFGYALVPLYEKICEITGINILALGERRRGVSARFKGNLRLWPESKAPPGRSPNGALRR